MELRKYLRQDFSKYIRNKLIKDKCEYCGSMNNLHLHHIDMFAEILSETLDELDLKELDTHEYSKKELMLIRNVMLGKQIKIDYVTLCEDCHRKTHGDITKNNYYNPYGDYIQLNIKELNKLNLDTRLIPKLVNLACRMDYENKIVFSYSGKKKRHSTNFLDIKELLKLSDPQYYEMKEQIIENNLISIDKNILTINSKYFIKGYNNDNNNIKLFCDNFIDLYNNISIKEHKLLGKVICNLKDMKNNKLDYKASYFVKEVLQMTLTQRVLKAINIHDTILIEQNKQILINPKYFYDGILNTSLQIFENDFKQLIK